MNSETGEPVRVFKTPEEDKQAGKLYQAIDTFRTIDWHPVYIEWGVARSKA